jgi:hypothetical protein
VSYNNPRIKSLSMSTLDIIVALAEGNIGAVRALTEIIGVAERVDPDSALGAAGPLFGLDTADIYGSRIWILYKDVCGQRADKVIGLLRAVQLGILRERDLKAALEQPPAINLEVDTIIAQVQERLKGFRLLGELSS